MMRMFVSFLLLSIGSSPLCAQVGPPKDATGTSGGTVPVSHAPYDFTDHVGWRSLFNGSTLDGWTGTPGAWRVENGAIVAADPEGPSYLLWGGGDVGNFELKTEIRLEGRGANSGIHFRAQMLGRTDKKNSEWESFGYQADYDDTNGKTGDLSDCCRSPGRGPRPRPDKASIGMVVEAAAAEGGKPMIVGDLGAAEDLRKLNHPGDWNSLHLIVRGTTIMYILNGRLISAFIDDNPRWDLKRGRLLLQMEFLNREGPVKVSFRNLWLKTLP